jgi:AcrR family transcriptional regulator
MPKIIENLERRLLQEAKQQMTANGYAALTIRSVAAACGVGVGTVYNYFPSKDALVAAFMLQDWNQCKAAIDTAAASEQQPEPVLRCIYDQLCAYAQAYRALFRDESANAAFAGALGRYHATLRAQLAAPLRPFCADDFTAEFAAEALLTWTMAGKRFEELSGILGKLF